MPDPNTHADDMKSPAEYTPPTIKDALPPMWWFCPWPVVTALADTIDHLKSTSRGEQAARISANQDANRWFMEARRLGEEIKDAKAALGSHGLHDGMTLNACGIKLVPSIERLVETHKTASDWNKELTAVQIEETKKRVELRDEVDALARKLGEARAERDEAEAGRRDYKHKLQVATDDLANLRTVTSAFRAGRDSYKQELEETKAELDALKSGEEQALQHAREQLAEANSAATEYRRQLDAVTSARDAAVDAVAELNDKLHREQVDHAATLGYVKMAEASLKRWKALAKARGNRLPAKKKKGVSK